jgi:putative transposase
MGDFDRGPAGPFVDLEVIRVEADMLTTRFCGLVGVPEKSWRRRQTRARAGAPVSGRGPARCARACAMRHADMLWPIPRGGIARSGQGCVTTATASPKPRSCDSCATKGRSSSPPTSVRAVSSRSVARRAFATEPTGPNRVWQLDFSEFETNHDRRDVAHRQVHIDELRALRNYECN